MKVGLCFLFPLQYAQCIGHCLPLIGRHSMSTSLLDYLNKDLGCVAYMLCLCWVWAWSLFSAGSQWATVM